MVLVPEMLNSHFELVPYLEPFERLNALGEVQFNHVLKSLQELLLRVEQ